MNGSSSPPNRNGNGANGTMSSSSYGNGGGSNNSSSAFGASAVVVVSPHHDHDHDDAKYDQQIKRRLRRKKLIRGRKRGKGGGWWASSCNIITTTATGMIRNSATTTTPSIGAGTMTMLVAVCTVVVLFVCSGTYHHVVVQWKTHAAATTTTKRQQKVERLQQADVAWQQQHNVIVRLMDPQHTVKKEKSDGVASTSSRAGAAPKRMPPANNAHDTVAALQEQFAKLRETSSSSSHNDEPKVAATQVRKLLQAWLDQEDLDVRHNAGLKSPRWIRPYLLPPHPDSADFRVGTAADDQEENKAGGGAANNRNRRTVRRSVTSITTLTGEDRADFFRVHRGQKDEVLGTMAWREEYERLVAQHTQQQQQQQRHNAANGDGDNTAVGDRDHDNNNNNMHRVVLPGPAIDYTDQKKYTYPATLEKPPTDGSYPKLSSLEDLMQQWPQDQDYAFAATTADGTTATSTSTIHETLQHFNYSDPAQLQMAKLFRDAELPFKLYGVPDVEAAATKWTDEYVGTMFGDHTAGLLFGRGGNTAKWRGDDIPMAKGTAQESRTNYFAFYVAKSWDVERMGLAPTRNNDWSYDTWAKHAVYADAVSLPADKPHFYWQSGVPPEERQKPKSKWCFISRDLPSFSSPEENFFVFHVQEQKGIQCRFSERGIVAATHFDGGRNMVAMLQGAKRYILSPPNQCSKLGIFTRKRSPIYRHSLLNFGHIPHLRNETVAATGMSKEERAWLERAATSQALETVLKQGEVLYIPSHWFHYIVSLQKSAQCNVRSGIDQEGTLQFGGRKEVEECID